LALLLGELRYCFGDALEVFPPEERVFGGGREIERLESVALIVTLCIGHQTAFAPLQAARKVVSDTKDPSPRVVDFRARFEMLEEVEKRFLNDVVRFLRGQSETDEVAI
jgi:hypothetical protein